jgi:hypothetical protein
MGIHGDQCWSSGPLGAEVSRVGDAVMLRQVREREVLEWWRIGTKGVTAGVSGGVIHDDDFVAEVDSVADGGEGLAQPGALVVYRQDDGYFRRALAGDRNGTALFHAIH